MARQFIYGWTKEQEETLVRIMKEGEGKEDVLVLFEKAGEELGRTAHAARNRWYIIRDKYTKATSK